MTDEKIPFEEALEKLEKASKELKNENIKLEDAIKSYEVGIKYYDICNKIIKEAKQRIEVYSK